MLEPGTAQAELQKTCECLVKNGVRVSDPKKRIQTYEKRMLVNGEIDRIKGVFDSHDGNRTITAYKARSEQIMINVSFSKVNEEKPSGFDLGDMEFILDNETITSKINKKFKMMIYLSIISLIDDLLSIKNGGKTEFSATDSSFSLSFSNIKDRLYIKYQEEQFGPYEFHYFMRKIYIASQEFYSLKNSIDRKDPAFHDLTNAFDQLKLFIKSS
ncbi:MULTISPECIES: hypothetical protein [unclassified Delftia]|uniref:hypothetical protein n=1 Tax=unclassified Delftia TaxID=2613839 RepID=UPI0019022FBC|nr:MULTISPECIES: hypothetical protein [unclassified Delftia]MBK0115767.1 hypothetical protein [Delftia sp. S65]MBK0121633.1 hypothetical protein [Delftia sp. S67]MBK0131571.1 hypothetical protein [Delftia sp. S66]